MQYRLLGNTGLYVSEICLGTMTFGGTGFWEVVGKLGTSEVEAFVGTALDAFERAVAACEDILECHLMSGDFDYLLRVAVADMRDYERVHRQRVAAFPHVARIRTAFAMRAVVARRGYVL